MIAVIIFLHQFSVIPCLSLHPFHSPVKTGRCIYVAANYLHEYRCAYAVKRLIGRPVKYRSVGEVYQLHRWKRVRQDLIRRAWTR